MSDVAIVDMRDNNIIDYLTCGQCDEEFPLHNITNFIQHKAIKCINGKFNNLNKNVNEANNRIGTVPKSLCCSSCLKEFSTARGLLKHVQFEHNINIFVSRINQTTRSSDLPDTESISDLNISDSGLDSNTSNSTIPEPSCCEKKILSERDLNCICRASGHCNSEKEERISSSPNSSSIEQGTQFCLMNQCTDITTNNEGETGICCNSEECCVTIIPGTHEEPRKCCNSVLPKKRKLHMVKHMNGSTDKENLNVALFKDKSLVNGHDSEKDCVSNHGSTGEITPVKNTDILTIDQEFIEAIDVDNNNKGRVVSPSHNRTDTFYTSQTVQQSCSSSSNQIEDILSSNIESMATAIILDPNTINFIECKQDEAGKDNSIKKRKYPTSRPYKCDSCSEAFNQRIHLKKHMSKHTGVKPFKCNDCDYSTVERSHLKVHTRIHTGEKPFNCPYCKYKTAQNSTLNIHLKRRHSEKLFRCNLCPKMFTQKSVLENHLINHQNSRISPFQDLQMSLNDLTDETFHSKIPAPQSTSTDIIPSIIGGELPLLSPLSNQILPDNCLLTNQNQSNNLNISSAIPKPV